MPAPSRGEIEGYRSGLEERLADQLRKAGVPVVYERHILRFVQPAKPRTYRPDFLLPNGIVIESKGRFVTADRQKHLFVKACHPDLDLRFVFSNPNSRIGKASQTTYAMWCEHNGFLYAQRWVPPEWLAEPPEAERLAAAEKALGYTPIR